MGGESERRTPKGNRIKKTRSSDYDHTHDIQLEAARMHTLNLDDFMINYDDHRWLPEVAVAR